MNKKILLVDDDASIRASLEKVLRHAGYQVISAADGVEAQDSLKDRTADLLILDLDMPRRDGWDVLDDVRAFNPALPVIVLTGMFDQLASFEMDGVYALMGKPVDAQTLLTRIERFLAGCTGPDLPSPLPTGQSQGGTGAVNPRGAAFCSGGQTGTLLNLDRRKL